MKLGDLVNGLDIVDIKGNTEMEITCVAYDSRKVREGALFVCVEGFKVDGHSFIATALENGAKAILVQKDVDIKLSEDITVIRIKDTRFGLASVADAFFKHPSSKFKLVGVTGTKGKTTTTYMIKSILEKAKQKVGLIGTISNKIGDRVLPTERTTPESYDLQALFDDMVNEGVDTVAMEVSSQGLELHRVSCCDYDIGVFTNFSQDHIGPNEHKNMEEYFNAKTKLFKMCKKALVNVDTKHGKDIIKLASGEIITYGICEEADIKCECITTNPDSVEFNIVSKWGNSKVKVGIPGKFTVYNALAAIGTCFLLNIPMNIIVEGLLNVTVPGRAEIVYAGDNFTVMVDYAHTPDSLENILSTVKGYAPGRVVCVFGCGGDRDRTKRPIMGEIAGRVADFTIITSDNPRTEDPLAIINDIEAGIKKSNSEYITIEGRRDAIEYSIKNAKKGDIIVLAGKGHETYQIFKDKTIHFDEREVVGDIIKSL